MNGRYRKVGLVSLGYLFFLFLFEKKVLNIRILQNNKMCIQIIIFFGLRIKMGIIQLSISIYDNNFYKPKKGEKERMSF